MEIYTGRGRNRRLVTTIEVLSPSNKTPGDHGRDLYVRKQQEILHSKVHLVEIDLLRGGQHTTAVPRQHMMEAVGKFDYHVCVHHFDNLEDFQGRRGHAHRLRGLARRPPAARPGLPEEVHGPLGRQEAELRRHAHLRQRVSHEAGHRDHRCDEPFRGAGRRPRSHPARLERGQGYDGVAGLTTLVEREGAGKPTVLTVKDNALLKVDY